MTNPINELYKTESEFDQTHIDPIKRKNIKNSIKSTDKAYQEYNLNSINKRFIDCLPIFDMGITITKDRIKEMKLPGSGGFLEEEYMFTLFFYRTLGVKYGYFYLESDTGNTYKFRNNNNMQIFMKLLENEYI
jgi:hypothetical protein